MKAHQRQGKCSRKLEDSLGIGAGSDAAAADLFPHDLMANTTGEDDAVSSPVARKRAPSPIPSAKSANTPTKNHARELKMQRILEEDADAWGAKDFLVPRNV